MVSPASSTLEILRIVFPQHVNPAMRLYGGRLMHWICEAGTMCANRHQKGRVILGAMEDIDILKGVALGARVGFTATVQATFGASMEVRIDVERTDRAGENAVHTCHAHLTFIALDDKGSPMPAVSVSPHTEAEHEAQRRALSRREVRTMRLAAFDADLPVSEAGFSAPAVATGLRMVTPEMMVGDKVFAGEVMLDLDEFAAIACHRYCRRPAVTASVDAVDFHTPIRGHELMGFRAALNYVHKSSMEVGVRVFAEDPFKGTKRRVCTAYSTFVALGEDGRPEAVAHFAPVTEGERGRFEAGARRRETRMARLGR